jgi:hypothetical protein
MKKLKKLLLVFTVLLVVQSCKKTDYRESPNDLKIERKKTLIAFNHLNNFDAISAYQSLTDDEIREFWIEHVNTFINSRTLNSEQISSTNTLLTYLQNADLNDEIYKTNFLSVWLPNALSTFSEQDVFLLAFSIFDNIQDDRTDKFQVNAPGSGGGGSGTPPKKSCRCEVGSNFWACALNPTKCVQQECKPSKSCGFLLLSECNGICDLTKN